MKTQLTVLSHPQFGEVRTVNIKNEIWFVAKDVCDVLSLVFGRSSIRLLDDDEKGVHTMSTPGGNQEMTIVNESGMYNLIFQSRKPEAKAFRKWVTSEVLPAIRKFGFYVHPSAQLSLSEIRRLERMMLVNVRKYITDEDVYKCSKKLRVDELNVFRVLNGTFNSNTIMDDLQKRAIANQERWSNAYSPERMQEVVNKLKS